MSKIHQVSSGSQYDKRFYVPGVKITRPCSKCSQTLTWDGSDNYLGYPEVGKTIKVYLYCEDCGDDVVVSVVLNMTVTELD